MAGRDLRIALAIEAAVGTGLAAALHAAGMDGWAAVGSVVALSLGLRAATVLLSYAVLLRASSPVPQRLQVGPLGLLRMALQEYAALLALFLVIQPFESLWMAPDRLRRPDDGRLPLLLLHGYTCDRGFWIRLRPRLEAAGWVVATHSLEPALADIEDYLEALQRRIDDVLAATGAAQLILVGHSMGGLVSRAYLRRFGPGRVARLVTLGSPHHGSLLARLALGRNGVQMHIGNPWLRELAAQPLPVPTTSIYSVHDNQVVPQRECAELAGARNVPIGGVSHLGMAFSAPVADVLVNELARPTL